MRKLMTASVLALGCFAANAAFAQEEVAADETVQVEATEASPVDNHGDSCGCGGKGKPK